MKIANFLSCAQKIQEKLSSEEDTSNVDNNTNEFASCVFLTSSLIILTQSFVSNSMRFHASLKIRMTFVSTFKLKLQMAEIILNLAGELNA